MTLEELIAEARERVGDVSEPYLCSNTRFAMFANDAQKEACRRARLLVDSTTEAVCQVTVTAGTAVYALDPRVLFVRRATLDGQSRPLVRIPVDDLDRIGTEWLDEEGDVDGWVIGMDVGKLRLFRKPTADGMVRLTVVRLPLADMTLEPVTSPEIDSRLHLSLVDWMEYRYYSTRDSEMKNEAAAAAAAAAFTQEFGPPATAIEEAWAREHYGIEQDGNVYQ